ncbi:hypothetical protein DL765_011263 [Monosporascus sp. GIB2]|nr:hypothetical protein DL765_011263 [Monosporascus sp. GIB2]
MHFTTHGPLAVALMSWLANATPVDVVPRTPHLGLLSGGHDGKTVSASVSLDVTLQDEVLVAGVIADAAVPPVLGAHADADLAVICNNCYTKGRVDASISLAKAVPALSLSLTDIEAYLDLDISIGAATTIAVNLFTPDQLIELSLPGLDVAAKIYLDLVLDVEAAIDVSAGLYITLADEATLETDILTGKILEAAFSGLSVTTLPVTVRLGCTSLRADLRLRVQLAAGLGLDGDVLPILDVLPDIGAGLEVAVFANLIEYVGFFCNTPSCPLSEDSFGLNVGAAVGLGVKVEDILTLRLAPTVSTALLSAPTSTHCEHVGPLPTGSGLPPASGITTGLPSGSGIPTATGISPSVILPTGFQSEISSGIASEITASSVTLSVETASTLSDLSAITPAPSATGGLITSIVTVPQTYTITTCAAHVPNCPGEYQEEKTVIHTVVYTTVCPATATVTDLPPKATHTSVVSFTKPQPTVTLVPTSCVETFTPPATVSKVTTCSSAAPTTAGSYRRSYPVAPYPVTDMPPSEDSTASSSASKPSVPEQSSSYGYESPTAGAETPVPTVSSPTAPLYPTMAPPPTSEAETPVPTVSSPTAPLYPTSALPPTTGAETPIPEQSSSYGHGSSTSGVSTPVPEQSSSYGYGSSTTGAETPVPTISSPPAPLYPTSALPPPGPIYNTTGMPPTGPGYNTTTYATTHQTNHPSVSSYPSGATTPSMTTYPSVPTYPTVPDVPGVPTQPSASQVYPTSSSGLPSPPPIATAGADRNGAQRMAGAIVAAGAFFALI